MVGLLNAIETAESESYGGDGIDGQLPGERAAAIDAYFGKNTMPAPEGNSQVISRDLFDAVEWILPSLTRIFAGSDEIVKVEPVGPDDLAQAQQETLFLNHVVSQRNQWEQVFHDWAWDALVTKNAYCLAYWDDSKEVEYERYQDKSEDELALIMADDVEVLEQSQRVDEAGLKKLQEQYQQAMMQYQQMAMQAQMHGQPFQIPPPPEPQPPILYTVKIRRTRENGKPCLRVLPPERCMIHQQTPNYTLRDCDFFEYWEDTTLSKIRSMGFDVPDEIDAYEGNEGISQEDNARDRFNENQARQEYWEPSMKRVKARMCWIRYDSDGDGIAELQYCFVVGRSILYREEMKRIPVASIVATPVPHRHIGLSIYDVVSDVQETKTQILRQGIDNLFHANNPRLFINEGKINLDDALVSRPGGIVRGLTGEQAAFGADIAPIVIPNVFPQAMQGMEYMDSVKQDRIGVNNYFTGTDENALNKTAHGISQLTSSAAQRVEQVARMMAPSVEYLFSCMHELICKHNHKAETIRLSGNWVSVDPSNWRNNRDLKIAVGLGSGSKDATLAHLQNIFQMQMATLPMGIADPNLIFNTAAEITKNAGFPTDTQFFKKPDPKQPPHPSPEQIKVQGDMQKQQAQMQADVHKTQAQWDYDLKMKKMDFDAEAQKMQFDANEKEKDRQLELAKTKAQESTKLAIAELNADQGMMLENSRQQAQFATNDAKMAADGAKQASTQVENNGNDALQNLTQAFMAFTQIMSKPRIRIPIRGKDGSIEQVIEQMDTGMQ